MSVRLDTVPVSEGQRDRRTDRRTELVKQHRVLHAFHVNSR